MTKIIELDAIGDDKYGVSKIFIRKGGKYGIIRIGDVFTRDAGRRFYTYYKTKKEAEKAWNELLNPDIEEEKRRMKIDFFSDGGEYIASREIDIPDWFTDVQEVYEYLCESDWEEFPGALTGALRDGRIEIKLERKND